MPASTNGGGQCLAFPDVCKTPSPAGPIPIPYPNIAMLTQASSGTIAKKVKIDGKKAVMKDSEISMSSGDEAGSAGGGVVSNSIKGPAKFKNGSSKVKVEGKPLVYIGCMAGQNGSNANMPAGAQVAPSQTKVLVIP
ncbi:MAG: DUF4150 domain-containing protein [bacterium]